MSLRETTIVVLGATGLVGRECLSILHGAGVPAHRVTPLATAASAGAVVPFGPEALTVREVTPGAFDGAGVAIFAASSRAALEWAPHALERGVRVVDNSSAFRLHPSVPLVVPEVNGHELDAGPPLVANPNCSTIILLAAVEPLRRLFGLGAIVLTTCQAVSGAGRAGLDALARESQDRHAGPDPSPGSPFPEPCTGNVFSHNSPTDPDDGVNGEERKIIAESRKILDRPDLPITPTCLRVPVARAHTESILVRLERPATLAEVRGAYADAPGLRVVDDRAANRFPTPRRADGADPVLVGRFRPDPAEPPGPGGRSRSWCFLACGDQIRKGAALNAVQIADRLASRSRAPTYA
ncbi:MAG: aspartate-semialdehyde dehydrogenase [Phycisphaeraceae bacterium]|nr:MAG: aspartate-semialdehyde dehydrogenase [Phycisphaeraceae bacterium]